jgi:predicted nucleotidyltransferase
LADSCPEIQFAYLFGSAAAGRMTPSSDIDIAAFVDPSLDAFDAQLNIMAAASRHLGTDRLDVVILNAAPVSLAGRVLGGRRVILDRHAFARHRYESLLMRQFADFRLYERRHFARRRARG